MDGRYRNWATILYPESAVENWYEILTDLKSPILISPLHDQDINPGGEKKKEHYHILFTFEGKKSREQIKEITDSIGSVGQEPVASLRGYARYLTHRDNPEKYQYDERGIRRLGGFDYEGVCGLPTDKYKAFREIQQFIRYTGIRSFATLADYAAENREDWYRIICDSGTIFLSAYMKSYHWEMKDDESKQERVKNFEKSNDSST